jgi:dTDP-glucose pyrophosphorylase
MPGRPKEILGKVCVPFNISLDTAIKALDRGGIGFLMLLDGEGRLDSILTDGDLRRAVLARTSLEAPARDSATRHPTTAPEGLGADEALYLMDHAKGFTIHHLPLLDADGRPVDLLLRRDLAVQPELPLPAVIMAGGFGTRLRPLTDDTPKPMLPVGGKPLMEHTIDRLKDAGIRDIVVTTHYRGDQIEGHFGDGSRFGVNLAYVDEPKPRGTAGALSLLPEGQDTLLVINGDILTRMDFRAMFDHHRKHKAVMSVGVRMFSVQVPYGVLRCEGNLVQGLDEKPNLRFLVNAGIYLVSAEARSHIPKDQHFHMTDLMKKLIDLGLPVVSFPILEYWLDIGRLDDYQKAQDDSKEGHI